MPAARRFWTHRIHLREYRRPLVQSSDRTRRPTAPSWLARNGLLGDQSREVALPSSGGEARVSGARGCGTGVARALALRPRDGRHGAPEKLNVLVEGLLEDALLVAVGAEAFGGVLEIGHGADTIALDALGAQVGHVG